MTTPSPEGAGTRRRVHHYEILEELGRGGVASVHRALDTRRDRVLAFKQLRPKHLVGEHTAQLIAGFEHEFQVLDQLEHPRIVRVFDYGIADGMPYYTMELLEGETLKQRLPLPVPELCSVLRDVASCLALLHARGYVHRDVGPRNVWCERDGRAKLLDFGAMVRLGEKAPALMGTPPYSPPEAVAADPLDGRADLFSLGALAYRAFVGADAYPARRFRDLRRVWRSGPGSLPCAHGAPEALSELIMELLSLDPAGRPASASEVMERLCAVANIEPDSDLRSAQAYLVTPPLIGRERELRRAKVALADASSKGAAHAGGAADTGPTGIGAALLFRGGVHMGHSRLLHQISRMASMQGIAQLRVHGRFVEGGPLGLLRALGAEALLRLPPEAIELARPQAAVLAHLLPELGPQLGVGEPAPLPPNGALARIVGALHAWFSALAEQAPLLILVDAVQYGGEHALGLLTELARGAGERKLVLVLAIDADTPARAPRMAATLERACELLELDPLDADEVARLVDALFWGSEHRQAVAQWMHRASGGVPGTCVALAQHLLDTGLARYDAGRWHLPAYPQEQGLPTSLRGVLERRIAALSPCALRLARGLALVHDDTRPEFQPKLHLSLAEQARLLETDEAEAVRCGDELLRAGLMRRVGECGVIAHLAVAQLLRDGLAQDEANDLHAALARVLMNRSGEHWSAVRQLQLAGLHREALDLMRERGEVMLAAGFEEMRLSLAADCFEAAIAYARQEGLPAKSVERLVDGLTMVLAVFDWARASLVLDELRVQCELRAAASAESEAHVVASKRVAAYCGALAIVTARLHDAEQLRYLIELLEGVEGVSASAAHTLLVARQLLELVEGHELSSEPWNLAYGYYALTDVAPQMRAAAVGVHAHTVGVWLAERGMAEAVQTADGFEAAVPGIWQAAHINWLAHGFRCDGEAMRRWEPRANMVAPDDLWRRRGYLMVEARLHALTRDLLALKGVLEELDTVAARFAGWRPWRDWALGEHHALRGSLQEARHALERALSLGPAGKHAAFGYACPALVLVESRLGEHDAAIARAHDGLAMCRQHRLNSVTGFDLNLALGEALSVSGEHDAAAAALGEAERLAKLAALGGIHRGRLEEASVVFAIRRDDARGAQDALRRLEPIFGASGIPQLRARSVRLVTESRRQKLDPTLELHVVRFESTDETVPDTVTSRKSNKPAPG